MDNFFISNEVLTRIISIFLLVIELQSVKSFFLNVFNLHMSKKYTFLFFSICFYIELICTVVLPVVVFPFINLAITFLYLLVFFKQDSFRSTFVLIMSISVFGIFQLLTFFIYSSVFKETPTYLLDIPAVNIVTTVVSYIFIFSILEFFKIIDFANLHSNEFSFYNKFTIIAFSLLEFFFVTSSLYMICKFFSSFIFWLFLTVVALNIFLFAILLVFIIITFTLEKARSKLDIEINRYNSLSNSYDGIREFKHDFSNIMQSIGGYLLTDDMDGLKSYYSSVFKECNEIKKLSLLNKEVFNSPPVLSLVCEKYAKAKKLGIEVNIEVLLDFNALKMDIYEFTRILGIFLDNSIEATSNAKEKVINILIHKDSRNHFDSIIIENSCNGTSIDTSKIFEKDFSTKPKNTGIGLWKVKKILEHYDNIFLNTSVNGNLFRHQLKIYY